MYNKLTNRVRALKSTSGLLPNCLDLNFQNLRRLLCFGYDIIILCITEVSEISKPTNGHLF